MKKLILTYLFMMVVVLTSYSSFAVPQTMTLKGSDTVLPLGQVLAEEYMKKNPKHFISVTGGGSGVGIASLIDGTCDIAMSSRDIKDTEIEKAKAKGRDVKTHLIGYDGLAVIVHPSNPITKLTIDQIAAIYTGQISNWKELGGKDSKIVVTSRESSSGTFVYFKEHVLKEKDYRPETMLLPSTANIVQTVKTNKTAIGYVGLAYVKSGVKALTVAMDATKKYVAPSVATVKDKSYPIARPLFFMTSTKPSPKQNEFLRFVHGNDGQKWVEKIGYISIK